MTRASRVVALGLALTLTLATRQTACAHGNAHERMQALTVEITKSPTNSALLFQRGELQLQHGEWLAALKDFEAARQLSPALPGLEHARARALAGARQLDEASAILDRLVTASPTNAPLRLDRARVLGMRGRTTEAVAEFTLTLRSSPRRTRRIFSNPRCCSPKPANSTPRSRGLIAV